MKHQRSKSVLIVDDDTEIRKAVAEILTDVGYRVHEASDGVQALAVLQHSTLPRLILLDLTMPTMNGWEFLNTRHQISDLRQIPVCVFSAMRCSEHDSQPAVADGYLAKPIDLDQLVATVEQFCGPAHDTFPGGPS